MSKRFWITVGVGAVFLYVWGFIAYMAIPVHRNVVDTFVNPNQIVESVEKEARHDGVYLSPNMHDHRERPSEYPMLFISYVKNGRPFFGPQPYFAAIAINIAISILLCWLSFLGRESGAGRKILHITFVGFVGSFASFVPLLNWFGLHYTYVLFEMVYWVVGFFLVSLPIAFILHKKPAPTHM